MMKSITLFICLLFITTAGISQEFNMLDTSPGEKSQFQEREWEPIELQDDEISWREKSIGIFFMPIPLNIDTIEFEYNDGYEGDKVEVDDRFTVGFGLSFNYDFKKSGDGLGLIAYGAIILGDGALSATDVFTALKYDIKLGALSKFELSPLVGIGNLWIKQDFPGADNDEFNGTWSSLYFSGGARITYLVINNLFVGADIQTTPFIFNTEKLLGLEEEGYDFIESAKIKYSFPVQVNLSVRYNIF